MRVLIALLFTLQSFAAELGTPLPRAHAHNDYEHPHPLWDALAQGFGSVEADIHLINDALLVAHDAADAKPDRTLESLYLRPLRELAIKNNGRVYPEGPPLILLIDIKSDAEKTYAELKRELSRYEQMLTRFTGDEIKTNAVTVILSGNRPRATLLAEKSRLAAFDGRLADLGQNLPISFMPLVSDNWRAHFKWDGTGELSLEDRDKLLQLVAKVHEEKRILRFWGAPDTRNVWHAFYASGVDLLNADKLEELARFLKQQ